MTRISFGIIALNAQPFLEYNLRALYPFAHQIIVVEGAVRAAASLAGKDGHSVDGTRAMLENFPDPQRKIELVYARQEGFTNGFWPEKDDMSRAYAKRVTGDWLWQVDSDEFYRQEDMEAVIELLESDPAITMVSFPYKEFFGGFETVITGEWHLQEYPLIHRLFKWEPGSRYVSHRPATVVDPTGVDLREKHWVKRPKRGIKPILIYHYSYVFPRQASQKVGYYSNVEWTVAFRNNQSWLEQSYYGLRRPMFLSEKGWPHLQWLERFNHEHPEQIEKLRRDLAEGRASEPLRPTGDIERLLRSPIYALERVLARVWLAVFWPLRTAWKMIRAAVFCRQAR
jgi:hypothetical protein